MSSRSTSHKRWAHPPVRIASHAARRNTPGTNGLSCGPVSIVVTTTGTRRALVAAMSAALLAVSCTSMAKGPPSPVPSATTVACTKSDVEALLSSFIRAIDSGDAQTITAALATAVVFSDDRRQVGGDVASPRDRDVIVRYFVDRHASGERFELPRGQANSCRDFEFELTVRVTPVGRHSAIGKGGTSDPADCSQQRIAVWNMVRQP
jgi:hypothetical protein